MSIRAINWVIELGERKDVTPTMRHILFVLANYASIDDEAYPRQTTIARITGLQRGTVCNNLGYLEEVGLIKATGRTHATGATRSSEYKLSIPDVGKVDPEDTRGVTQDDTRGVRQDDRGVTHDDSGCNPGEQGGVTQDDTFNHHLEPQLEPKHKPRRTAPWPEDWRNQFWSIYPKKAQRKTCFDKLERIEREDTIEFSTIIDGLRRYVKKTNGVEDRYILLPVTFINQARWDDEDTKRPPPPPKRSVAI
jgi:hypothetical protein